MEQASPGNYPYPMPTQPYSQERRADEAAREERAARAMESIRAARQSLVTHFKDVEEVLATSEADRRRVPPPAPWSSSSLLNSELSPYGCDENVTSLGIKYWGFQPGLQATLEDVIIPLLPLPLRTRFMRLMPWAEPQACLDRLAELGLVTKEILSVFRALGITSLYLAPSLGRDPVHPRRVQAVKVLKVFRMPHSFRDLQILSLYKVQLEDDDLKALHGLKLVHLDISGTGISSEGTAHLVALKASLKELHLSNNPKVKHWACYNIACLKKLEYLLLDGTEVRMLSLRYLCEKWPAPKVLTLSVPIPCQHYLEALNDRYHMIIPKPYISSSDEVIASEMAGIEISGNLAFHQRKDKSITMKGSTGEQILRLKKHLKRREADMRLRAWTSRNST